MVDLSVAICTYNGESRLPEVLDRLQSQVGTEDITWEVIIVDNNSTDNTAKVIRDYQAHWSGACAIHGDFEPQQGKIYAQHRAVQRAQGTLIGFLDDDNLPTPEWVAETHAFGQAHPKAGAYSGKIHGDFEIEPPQNFKRIAPFLAVGGGEKAICYTSDPQYAQKRALPPGAGIVIRRQAWLESVPDQQALLGRIGNSMVGGEDIETLLHIRQQGWEIWYNPKMCIRHQIPKQRLTREYLLKLMRGAGLSRYHTRMLGFKAWQRPLVLPAYMSNDLRKLIVHYLKYREQLKTDVVAACELELFLGSLISPFYFLRRQLFDS